VKKDWEIKKLKDICEKGSSNVNMKDLAKNEGAYPIYNASGFIKNVDFYHQEHEYIALVKDGSIGKMMLLPAKSSVIGTIQYILPKKDINLKFLFYFLQTIDFSKFKQGAAIPHIYFRDYGETELVVPPLEEQKRIVKILDEKFAQLETIKTNAQTNLQNAKDLFQSEFVNIFNKANTIRMITVETVCSSIVDCPHSTPKWITNGKLCLRTTNFKPNQIDLSTKYYVSDETYNERVLRLKPQPGDIVFSREGGILGIACVIPNDIYPCLGQRMMLLRPRKETDNRFLMYYLNSPMIEKIIKSKILGAAAPHINVADVKSFPIPEFPLPEQKRIVKELDALSEKVRLLQEIYTKQIANCEELKQSLLQKAFEGEL